MMTTIRNFLRGSGGMAVAGVIVVIAGVLLYTEYKASGSADPTAGRWFVDSSTTPPKAFQAELKAGMAFPIDAPSGGKTGYPAEECYWTADGKIKVEPTYVLLNSWINKSEPTFCPDCGRLVVGHNPKPGPNDTPPQTETEYRKKHPGNATPAPVR